MGSKKVTCSFCGGAGNVSYGGGPFQSCSNCFGSGYVVEYQKDDFSFNSSDKSNNRNNQYEACFSATTKVYTSTGLRNIASIKQGETVLTLDSDGNGCWKEVLKCKQHKSRHVYNVTNGSAVFGVTTSHSVLASHNHKWMKVRELKLNSPLAYFDKNSLKTGKIDHIQYSGKETVYNLIVEDNFTFVVDGCVAHSFTHFRAARILFWKLFARTGRLLKLRGIRTSALFLR